MLSRLNRFSISAGLCFLAIGLPQDVRADETLATGFASAKVIEPLSVMSKNNLTFVARPAGQNSGVNDMEAQAGQLEIRAPGAFIFSLDIQQKVRATSTRSQDSLVVDQIAAHGPHRLEATEWLGKDGAATVRISGRLNTPESAAIDNYTGYVLVNLAYN